MRKRRLSILIGLLIILAVTLPLALKAIPPRYAARLPEPLAALAQPQQTEALLPTAVPPAAANAAALLQTTATPPPSPTIPPTQPANQPTSQPTNQPAHQPTSPPTPTATATPTPSPTPWPIPATHRLTGITHQFQEWNNCGPATLAMTLSYFDLTLRQSQTAAVLKPNPEDRNVSPGEMAAYVNDETPYQAITRVNGDRTTLRRLLAHDIPVIVEIGIDPPGEYRWLGWYGHYLLLVAYDDAQERFWVYDSWFGTSAEPQTNAHPDGRILTYADVAEYWPQFNRTYIAVYRPEQAATVAAIIGADIDEAQMWSQALADAQQATTAAPQNPFNWFNLGSAYNALGQYEAAAVAFDQARSIGLPWRMLWYQFGPYEAYYQIGRYDDLILLADTTLKDRPYFEESFYYKGLARIAQGQTTEGRDLLQKAIDLNLNFTPAQTALQAIDN